MGFAARDARGRTLVNGLLSSRRSRIAGRSSLDNERGRQALHRRHPEQRHALLRGAAAAVRPACEVQFLAQPAYPGIAVWSPTATPLTAAGAGVADRSATGEPVADRRGQLSWALFEFSRSPYLSLVYIYVFATYFTNTVIGDPVRGQELWSLANTLVGVCVAVLAPITGAISDRMGRRKPWIVAIALIMGAGCIALWWAMPGAQGGLPVAVILATHRRPGDRVHVRRGVPERHAPVDRQRANIGGLSGLGIAVGNAGSLSRWS